jgi:hypothetical protein
MEYKYKTEVFNFDVTDDGNNLLRRTAKEIVNSGKSPEYMAQRIFSQMMRSQ